MDSFATQLHALIDPDTRGNARAFTDKTGLSPSYLSEILTKGKLPTLAVMKAALAKAGTTRERADAILLALSVERARADEDTAPAFTWLESRLTAAETALADLAALAQKSGAKLPKSLLKTIESLGDPH